ncbi:MAG: chemotaxis protein methyltransferase CheR [Paraglaciecola sp.]|jgi:chemotaxis protein methyltransferase CheR
MEQGTISNIEFNLFRDFIYEQAGIRLSDQKKIFLVSRLSKRLRHYAVESFQDFFDLMIASGPDGEQQVVIDLLTTNETYFFREPKHFEFLADQILPKINKNKSFRVWSAASSGGQEAYSVAMLLDDKLNDDHWEILGSDINLTVLQQAMQGLYPQDRIQGIPTPYLQKYCYKGIDEYEGQLLIDENLINKVKFSYINLTLPLNEIGTFELILLRNILIYFDMETKSQIIKRIEAKLEPGGYLFIGHAESIKDFNHGLIPIAPSIYRKKHIQTKVKKGKRFYEL